ncbi:MAG: hypothetical protein HOM97_09575 [Nitrospina sp.]|jgi:DNA-binding response OmpR family regulator|nr:hypothetical protein [Nitrospina sp.]
MRDTEHFSIESESTQYAFIISDEVKICELVAFILKDIGFITFEFTTTSWLEKEAGLKKPQLMVWDLGNQDTQSALESFLEVKERSGVEKVKTLLLAGQEFKTDCYMNRDRDIQFCSKPFSPRMFRFEVLQLFKGEYHV